MPLFRRKDSGAGEQADLSGPPDKPADYTEQSEIPDLVALNRKLDGMVAASQADARDWEPIATEGRNYLWSNQFADAEPKAGWDQVADNLIFPGVMQEQALISQQRSTLVVRGWDDSDQAGAEHWAPILTWYYERQLDVPALRLAATADAKERGQGILRVRWEDRADWDEAERQWKGQLEVELVPSDLFGIDPRAELLPGGRVDRARWVYVEFDMDLEDAIARWPDDEYDLRLEAQKQQAAGDELGAGYDVAQPEADGYIEKDGAAQSGEAGRAARVRRQGLLATLLSGQRGGEDGAAGADAGASPLQVRIQEFFVKDAREEEISEEVHVPMAELLAMGVVRQAEAGEGDGEPQYVLADSGEVLSRANWPTARHTYRRPMFPRGRRILRVGNRILNPDRSEQVWWARRWPYVVVRNYELPHNWHGLTAAYMSTELQDAINEVVSHLVAYIRYFADPVRKVEEGALQGVSDNDNVAAHLQATPGAIWRLASGKFHAAGFESPPPLSPAALQIYQLLCQEERDQQGVQEIGLGRQASGSMTATEALRLHTNTRLRTALQAVVLDRATIALMEICHEFLRAYLSVGDQVRISGADGLRGTQTIEQVDIDAEIDLDLEITTTLPYAQDRAKQEAMELYQLIGLPYLDRLLRAYEVKDREQLLRQVAAWQQLQAMAEAQEAAESGGAADVVSAHPAAAGEPPAEAQGISSEGEPVLPQSQAQRNVGGGP